MTYRQGLGTRGVAWLVVGVAIIAALGWWWWSGRGPVTLTELGVLPPQLTANSDPASALDVHEVPNMPQVDDDDLGVVIETVGSAEPQGAAEAANEASAAGEVEAEGDVAISGLMEVPRDGAERLSGIAYPLPALPADRTLEAVGVEPAVDALVPPRVAARFLQSADFAHHFVATVDNFGRSYAPASRWPVSPAPDRFTFEERDGRTYIAPDNYVRYAPLVQLAETLDARTVVDLYVRMYPQLQAAYADIGFPNAYFNDRLMEVVALLLASPEPSGPLEVEHTPAPNRPAPARPWTNYQFADPALDALTAGQKIMIRVGPDNERRLKAKLAELRQELLTRVLPGQ